MYLICKVGNVGNNANMPLLTAANQKRTALGIQRKLPQMHGTTGFYGQPVKQSAEHSHIA
jgi:hypothetical protein